MSVALAIAVAVGWWSAHGYTPAQPITWEWGTCPPPAHVDTVTLACAVPGSYHITLIRSQWDQRPRWQRCTVVAHEIGHAAFKFDHKDGTVMEAVMTWLPVPSACLEPPLYSKPIPNPIRPTQTTRKRTNG